MSSITLRFVALVLLLSACGCSTPRIDHAAADERFQLISENRDKLVVGGRITRINWSEDGSAVSFTREGERFRLDLSTLVIEDVAEPEERSNRSTPRARRPARGRQFERAESPDGQWVAICRDWNVVLEPAKPPTENEPAHEPLAITTDGHRKFRYGTASWVYGEELDVHDAMWWSPDSRKLAFYEFDERLVPDHYITAGLTDLHTKVLTEGYPKAGEPNPIANILIYDLETRALVRVQEPPAEDEWYTYSVQFTPKRSDGQPSPLLLHRTNRHQNVLHLMLADPETGQTRTILTETQETWQENSPQMRFLKDGHRFIWTSERTGNKQLELRDLDGNRLATLTHGDYPVATIVHLDEDRGVLYYTAYSDANPLNNQLHRVNLDGSGGQRLTQEPFNHSITMSPRGTHFITEYQAIDHPPVTALYDTQGNRLATLAESNLSRFRELNLQMPELFTFKADDGVTDLYGVLYKPSSFNPRRRYPLVIEVYGGPTSQAVRNRFNPAKPECEYGFIIAQIDNRGTGNRGKAFESAVYLRLGDVDLKDQADGVRHLAQRRYIDSSRVGITGHSYGGYMAALALLKFPDLYHVAVAGGSVTDWRNYDTIYTERYMRTPQENPEGYDVGSCMKYVEKLQGKLLLLHGMIDDNVHPNNVWQLIDALQKANKSHETIFFPNAGHSLGPGTNRHRWQYFRHHLLN